MLNAEFSPAAMWCCVAMIQTVGLTSTWLARASEGFSAQRFCQFLFFAAFMVMGGTTALALWMGWGLFIASCAVLSVMAVGVTCDFSRRRAEA